MREVVAAAGLQPEHAPNGNAPECWRGGARYLEHWACDPDLSDLLVPALGPFPADIAVDALAKEARSGAARVFVLHGNVRDYGFHPDVGYAAVPQILEHLWRSGAMGSVSADVLSVSAAVGLELRCPEGATADVRERVKNHRVAQKGDHEARVQHDLAVVDDIVSKVPSLVLVERADLLFPASGDAIRSSNRVEHVLRWATKSWGTLVVLLAESPDDLHAELRKRTNGIAMIELPRPNATHERLRFLVCASGAMRSYDNIPLPGTRLTRALDHNSPQLSDLMPLAAATTGLNLRGLEACLMTADGSVVDSARAARMRLLRAESEGLLIVEEPKPVELVGRLREQADELSWLAEAMKNGEREIVPMGMLFVGVPGTGKSYLASALAARCHAHGVQYVRLGDFRDMWVGSTERNFSRALDLIATFGRCIVFMDEVDQSEGGDRGGTRHEVSKRVFGKLLEFMSKPEHRGNVLWIAATNRPDQLDPAMVRPGRFDLIVKFAPPDATDCGVILAQMLARVDVTLRPADLATVAEACASKALVGAEIELIVTEARRRARREGGVIDAERLMGLVVAYLGNHKKTRAYEEMRRACDDFERFKEPR